MNYFRTSFIGCIGSLIFLSIACNSPQRSEGTLSSDRPDEHALRAPNDPLLTGILEDTGHLGIVAGKAVGRLQLKMPSDTLIQLIGKPDSADAAMCKDLTYWASESAQLRIYSLCDNDLDMRKSIQVIAVCGTPFQTEEGITAESNFSAIKRQYPGTRLFGKTAPGLQATFLVGDTEKGIAFELNDTTDQGRVHCVLVHLPGERLTATNIPLYPGLTSPTD